MNTPCSRIAGLVSEALNVEKCYRVSAGNVLLQLLGLAAGLAGRQIRFARQDEHHPLNLSMIIATPDATMPSWMRATFDEALSLQDDMEQTEESLLGARMSPEVHRELRRKLALFRSLGSGFESRALLVEEELAAAKLTVNIDLVHEVGRLGGRRVSERPPVGESILVLASDHQEILALKKDALKTGGLWNQLERPGRAAVTLQAWCSAGQLTNTLSPDPHAAAARIGYIFRCSEEMPVEGYFLPPRSASGEFLYLMRNRRITGGYTLVDPHYHLAELLEGACDGYLNDVTLGLASQARHVGTPHDLPWHIVSLLLPILDPDGINDLDSYIDLATLVCMLARELMVSHLEFLSEIRPVGPEGVLSGLHRSFMARLSLGPAKIRDLQRAQRCVSKFRCLEVLKELAQLGLVETSDGKTYYRPAPMASGLSEFLSDFVEKHRFD
jgi:hypothetical protein